MWIYIVFRHVHVYQPLFEGIVAKLTVVNNLSIFFNSEQNSGKYTVWWLSKKINLKHFWKTLDKSSVKVKILLNVLGKETIKNKWGLKFHEMIKPLITFFRIHCFKLELLGSKVGTVSKRFGTFLSYNIKKW